MKQEDAARAGRFQELLDSHRGILLGVANAYCRQAEDRRDLVQEISLQLWRAFPAYDAHRSFSTWTYRIALNVAISFARSARNRERHSAPLDPADAERLAAASDPTPDARMEALYRCLDECNPLDRALLLLYLDDRSYREIAEILGIRETNVGTRLSRLKQRIRKEAAAEIGDEREF
jgi:RNA polymerase sigma factor (sigma-70 family)